MDYDQLKRYVNEALREAGVVEREPSEADYLYLASRAGFVVLEDEEDANPGVGPTLPTEREIEIFKRWFTRHLSLVKFCLHLYDCLEPLIICGFGVTRDVATRELQTYPEGTFLLRFGSIAGMLALSVRMWKGVVHYELSDEEIQMSSLETVVSRCPDAKQLLDITTGQRYPLSKVLDRKYLQPAQEMAARKRARQRASAAEDQADSGPRPSMSVAASMADSCPDQSTNRGGVATPGMYAEQQQQYLQGCWHEPQHWAGHAAAQMGQQGWGSGGGSWPVWGQAGGAQAPPAASPAYGSFGSHQQAYFPSALPTAVHASALMRHAPSDTLRPASMQPANDRYHSCLAFLLNGSARPQAAMPVQADGPQGDQGLVSSLQQVIPAAPQLAHAQEVAGMQCDLPALSSQQQWTKPDTPSGSQQQWVEQGTVAGLQQQEQWLKPGMGPSSQQLVSQEDAGYAAPHRYEPAPVPLSMGPHRQTSSSPWHHRAPVSLRPALPSVPLTNLLRLVNAQQAQH